MQKLNINPGDKTPVIDFDVNGKLIIGGKSIPENTPEFYQPVFDWLDEYSKSPAKITELNVHLEYFNTSSSKCLLDLFRKLEVLKESGKSEVSVIWIYEEEDEDMLEAGEDYKSLLSIDFILKESA